MIRLALFAGILVVTPLGAQTVRPAVVEYQEAARGRFELVNETLFPLTVVLEPRSFQVDSVGDLTDAPLDTTRIRVKLSAMSFRIPPMQSYTVSYEASATELPAWFMISSALSGARTNTGLNVRIELPHVVYLLQKQPLRRTDVVVRSFQYDSAAGKAVVELENVSDHLGRVMSSELSAPSAGRGGGVPGGGFPLFPQSRRRVEMPWQGGTEPERVVLRFANFTVDERRSGESR
jgi:hypothetical protein